MNDALIQAWSSIVGGEVADADLDLAACALLIAEVENPGLSAATYLTRLDALAAAVRPRAGESLLDATLRHLFVDQGFRGNSESYYDPANSCLDQVLDRRRGIPITLSVVLLEVGWRLGLEVAGVGFPGHFLVSARTGGSERILDPFGGGATLDRPALDDRLAQALGPGATLAPAHLRPVGKREILTRMLHNLQGIYRNAGDARRLGEVAKLLSSGAQVRRESN